LVADAKPDNFKKDRTGRLIAIDLIVHRLTEESDVHFILTGT
jgi:hypothetical protein